MFRGFETDGYRPALRLLCLIYYVISISYRVCFLGGDYDPYRISSSDYSSLPVVMLDALADLFFIVDTLFQGLEEWNTTNDCAADGFVCDGRDNLDAKHRMNTQLPFQSQSQQRRSLQLIGRRSVSKKSIFVKRKVIRPLLNEESDSEAARQSSASTVGMSNKTRGFQSVRFMFNSAVFPSPADGSDSAVSGRDGASTASPHLNSTALPDSLNCSSSNNKNNSLRIISTKLQSFRGEMETSLSFKEVLFLFTLNCGSFMWQLLLLFPLEAVAYGAGMRYRFYWLRSFRLLRCYYIFMYWKQIRIFILEKGFFQVQPAGMQRILFLTMVMAVIGHVAACFFYALAFYLMDENGIRRTWLSVDGIAMLDEHGGVVLLRSIPYIYLRSLYWSIETITNVAFGDIGAFTEAETWFCIFYFYLAALLVYFSIANFILVITNLDSARNENLIRIAKFERYAAYRKLPAEMINRVVSYYEYQWDRLRGIDEQQILAELPANLAQQLAQCSVRDMLTKVDIMRDLHKGCLNVLSEKVEVYVFSPNDVIVVIDSLVTGLYMISSGVVSVTMIATGSDHRALQRKHALARLLGNMPTHQPDGESIAPNGGDVSDEMKSSYSGSELRVGQYFGVRSMYKNYTSVNEYSALTFCEVLLLRGSVFRHSCEMYLSPSELDSLISRIVERNEHDSASGLQSPASARKMHDLKRMQSATSTTATDQIREKARTRRSTRNFNTAKAPSFLSAKSQQQPETYIKEERKWLRNSISKLLHINVSFPPETKENSQAVSGHQENGNKELYMDSVFDWQYYFLAPGSIPRLWWDTLLFICLTFYLLSTGLLLSATIRDDYWAHYQPLLMACFAVDFIFFIDAVLTATVFGFSQDGAVVLSSSLIWRRYCTDQINLVLTVVSIFPFDVVLAVTINPRLISLGRLTKLMYLHRFAELEDIASDLLLAVTGIAMSFEMERFFILYYTLFFMCHCAACIWQLVADASIKIFGYEESWRTADMQSELYRVNYSDLGGTAYYWRSLYWAVNTMSCIGTADVIPTNGVELACIILLMFFGFVMFNAIIGAIASLMNNFSREARDYEKKIARIQQLVRYKNIPQALEKKIIRYHEHIWARYGGVEEVEILASLPPSLRSIVAHYVIGPLLFKIPFLSDLSEPMELLIVSLFESRIFMDGDPLMVCGDIGKEMFIIEHGKVEVTSFDRASVFATLEAGDYVGESCLLDFAKRIASVYAVGYVDTFCLSSDHFLQAAEKFPSEYDSICRAIEKTLKDKTTANVSSDEAVGDERAVSPENLFAGNENYFSCDDGKVRVTGATSPAADACVSVHDHLGRKDVIIEENPSSACIEESAHDCQGKVNDIRPTCTLADNCRLEQSAITDMEGQVSAPQSSPYEQLHTVEDSFEASKTKEDVEDEKSVASDIAAVASEGNIHPDSQFKLCWDAMMCFIVIYYSVVIPIRIVVQISPYVLVVDYMLDAVMLLDSYLCVAVFAIYAAGELLVYDPDIRANYFRQRFLVDAICEFPYDLIGLGFLSADRDSFYLVLALLRLPKLIKLTVFTQYYKYPRMMLNQLKLSFTAVRLLELIVSLLVVSNWVGCGFLAFAVYGQHPGDCSNMIGANYGDACEFRDTWVEQQIATDKLPQDGGTRWSKFLRAFYWAVTTCVGITMGDVQVMNSKEVIYAFFMMIGVLAVNGMIIGSVMNLVAGASEDSTEIYRAIEVLKSYLRAHGVEPVQIVRAVAMLRHFASDEGLLMRSQEIIFAELPHSIRLSIDTQIKTIPYLRRCPVYDFCSDELLRGIASHLRLQFYVKGDAIVSAGELGYQMYFLEAGTVQVVSADGTTVLTNLEEGGFFGETAFFFNTARTASVVVSSAFCACLALNKTDLEHELRSTDFDPVEVLEAFNALQLSNSRRNAAVQRNLQLATDPTSKLHKILRLDLEKDEMEDSPLSVLRKYLHPSSMFRILWDTIGLMLLGYYTCSIPFYIAFFLERKIEFYISRFVTIDFLVDFYWVIDIVLKAFLFSVKLDVVSDKIITDGSVIWDRYWNTNTLYSALSKISKNLLDAVGHEADEVKRHSDFGAVGSGGGGYFVMDIIASLPLEIIVAFPRIKLSALFYFRVQHLLRVVQIPRQLDLVEEHLQNSCGVALPRALSLLFRAALLYLVLNHWVTCCFFMIHRYAERNVRLTYVTADGFATFDDSTGRHDICNDKLSFCYARSLYFVVGAMAGIGYGDITPYTDIEFLFQIIVAIISAFLAAMFLGFCGIYLEDRDALSSNAIKRKLADVETYLTVRDIPKRLRDAVLAQYTHIWRKMKSFKAGKSNELMQHLSQPLAMDLSLHLHKPVLSSIPILRQLPPQVMRRIAFSLRPQVALPQSILYRAGDVGKNLFFIHAGSVRIRLACERSALDSRGLTALRILLNKETACGEIHVRGDHFGEYCILSESGLRTDTAFVMSSTEVYSLDKRDLWATFLYCTQEQRCSILNDLMTRVGEKVHVPNSIGHSLDRTELEMHSIAALEQLGYSAGKGEGDEGGTLADLLVGDYSTATSLEFEKEHADGRIQTLYRLSFHVMISVVIRMECHGLNFVDDEEAGSTGDAAEDIGDNNGRRDTFSAPSNGAEDHKELRKLLREQTSLSTSTFTRKDLIDLFLGQRSKKSSFRFSAAGLRSRLNSMHSNGSMLSQRSLDTEHVDGQILRKGSVAKPLMAWDGLDLEAPSGGSRDVKKPSESRMQRRSIAGTSMSGVTGITRVSMVFEEDSANDYESKHGRVDENIRWRDTLVKNSDPSDVSIVDQSDKLPEVLQAESLDDDNMGGTGYKFSTWERRTSRTDFEALRNAMEIEERLNNGNRRKSVF